MTTIMTPARTVPARTVPTATSAVVSPAPARGTASAPVGDVVAVFPRLLDVHSAHAYRRHMLEVLRARPTRVIVDLSLVEDLDVVAGALLVGVQRRLTEMGGQLVLVNVPHRANTALRRFGLSRLFGQTGRGRVPGLR